MTRPTKAELDRYREGLTNGRWRFISTGIGQELLAEIDALRAEADLRERELREANGRNARLLQMLDWWGKQHPDTRFLFVETFTITTSEAPPARGLAAE
jgi:hypothetical protein